MEDRAEAKQRAESLAATSEPPEEREIPRPAVVDQAIQGVDIPILDVQDRALIIPRAGDGPESVAWVPRASGVQHWHDNETLVSVGDGEGGAVFDIRHDHAGGGLDVESLPVASHPSTGVRYEMVSCHHMQYDALTACLSFNGKIQVRSNHRHPEFLECPAGFLATGMRWHPDEALLIVFGISPTASLSSNETTSGETENPTLVLFDLADIYDSYYKSTFVQLKTTFNGSMIQDACWAGSKHPRFSIFAVTDHQLHRLEFDRELNTLHDGVVRQNEELAYQGLRPLISNNDQLIALVNIRSNGSLELGVGQGSVEYASRDETFEGIIECSKDPHEVIIDAQWKHGKLKEGILENSAQIIVALHSGIVQIWNVSEAEPGQTALSNLRAEQLIRIEANGIPSGLPVKEIHSITCIDLSKDDRFLAVGSIENALLIWDLADVLAGRTVDPIAICRPVDSVFKEEQSSINDDALKWSPSGHLIAHKVGSMVRPPSILLISRLRCSLTNSSPVLDQRHTVRFRGPDISTVSQSVATPCSSPTIDAAICNPYSATVAGSTDRSVTMMSGNSYTMMRTDAAQTLG